MLARVPLWARIVGIGLGAYAVVAVAAANTENEHLYPTVISLGALLVPVAFVAFVYQRAGAWSVSLIDAAACFLAGGILGTVAAAVLEYRTLRDFGVLPSLAVGLVEEACKLAVALVFFAGGRLRTQADGLLIGVAAGMGFAAFETMGYGLVTLLQSGGRIGPVEQVLFVRGVLSPAGHAAWTGLVCAAVWRARLRGARAGPDAAAVAAFAAAVLLHGAWDANDSTVGRLVVGAISVGLLGWCLRTAAGAQERPRAERRPGPAAQDAR